MSAHASLAHAEVTGGISDTLPHIEKSAFPTSAKNTLPPTPQMAAEVTQSPGEPVCFLFLLPVQRIGNRASFWKTARQTWREAHKRGIPHGTWRKGPQMPRGCRNSIISFEGAKNGSGSRMSGIDQYLPHSRCPHHQSLHLLYVNEINHRGFL